MKGRILPGLGTWSDHERTTCRNSSQYSCRNNPSNSKLRLKPPDEKYEPDIGDDDRAFWNQVSFADIVLGAKMSEGRRREGVPSKRLLEYGLDVRQVFPIFRSREPTPANDSVDFFLCLPLNFRVNHHAEEENRDQPHRLRYSSLEDCGRLLSKKGNLTVSAPAA